MPESSNGNSSLLARRSMLFPCLLIVVGVATYANSLGGKFIYDDGTGIVNNPYIRQLSTFWQAPPDGPTEGRPVIGLSLAINYALGGIKHAGGYHAVNIAVHILAALVFYGIVRRTLLLESLRARFGRAASGIALACALLWMVHPLVSECVSFTIQRTESIMALFYLLTLYCAIRAIDSPRWGWWMVASVASCALGMGSKEVMVTAPVVVFLYDLVFHPGSIRQTLRVRAPLYVGLAATWGVLAALMWYFPHQNTVGFSHGVDAWQYAKNQAVMIVQYLQLVVWPHPLTIDYGVPRPYSLGEVLPYGLVVVGLLAATVAALIFRPMLGFLGAWFFIILSPTSSFVPLRTEVGAERRMYLPLAALVVLVVLGGYLLFERMAQGAARGRKKKAAASADGSTMWTAWLLTAAVAVLLAAVTFARNRDFQTSITIWRAGVAATPHNHRAHFNLGLELAQGGEWREAMQCYERALELNPDYVHARTNLGNMLSSLGRSKEAEPHLLRAVEIGPDIPLVHCSLGTTYAKLNKLDAAEAEFRKAIELDPKYAEAYNNLGQLVQQQEGRSVEAIDYFKKAIELKPNDALNRQNLGALLWKLGRKRESFDQFKIAIRLDPNNVLVCYNLGVMNEQQKHFAQAAKWFRRVLEIDPNYTDAHRALDRLQKRLKQVP